MPLTPILIRKSENLSEEQRRALLWVVRDSAALQRDALKFIDDDGLSAELLYAMLSQYVDDWNSRWPVRLQLAPLITTDSLDAFYRVVARDPPPDDTCALQLVRRRFTTGTRVVLTLRAQGRFYTYADHLWPQHARQPAETLHIFNYLDFYADNAYYVMEFMRSIFDADSGNALSDCVARLQQAQEKSRQPGEARAIDRATMRRITLQVLFDANYGNYLPLLEEPDQGEMQLQANYMDDPRLEELDREATLEDSYHTFNTLQTEIYYALHSPHGPILYQSRVLSFDKAYELLREAVHTVLRRLRSEQAKGCISAAVPFASATLQLRSPTYLTMPVLERTLLDDEYRATRQCEDLEQVRAELLRRLRALLVERNLQSQEFVMRVDADADRHETIERILEEAELGAEEQLPAEVQQAVIEALDGERHFVLTARTLSESDYVSLAHFGLFLSDRVVGYFCSIFLSNIVVDFRAHYDEEMQRLLHMRLYERQNVSQLLDFIIGDDDEELELYYDAQNRLIQGEQAVEVARQRTKALRQSAAAIGDRVFKQRRSCCLLFGNNYYVDEGGEIVDTGLANASLYALLIFIWVDGVLYLLRVGDERLDALIGAFLANLELFDSAYVMPRRESLSVVRPSAHFHIGYVIITIIFELVSSLLQGGNPAFALSRAVDTRLADVEASQQTILAEMNANLAWQLPDVYAYLRQRYSGQFQTENASQAEKQMALIERMRQFDARVPDERVGDYVAPLVEDLLSDEAFNAEALDALMRDLLSLRGERDYSVVPDLFETYRRATGTRDVQMRAAFLCHQCARRTWLFDTEASVPLCSVRCQQVYWCQ